MTDYMAVCLLYSLTTFRPLYTLFPPVSPCFPHLEVPFLATTVVIFIKMVQFFRQMMQIDVLLMSHQPNPVLDPINALSGLFPPKRRTFPFPAE